MPAPSSTTSGLSRERPEGNGAEKERLDFLYVDNAQAWEGYVLYHCWTILQPTLPFVLMSDRSDGQALSVLRHPAVRFLAKPFTPAALLDTLTAFIKA